MKKIWFVGKSKYSILKYSILFEQEFKKKKKKASPAGKCSYFQTTITFHSP